MDGKVVLVDQLTGRRQEQTRLRQSLHTAIEVRSWKKHATYCQRDYVFMFG